MKAFLIDTPQKSISEIEYDDSDYKNIYPIIQAEMFELVYINKDRDAVFVDEEGLLNGNPHGWFYIAGHHQPIRGFGLVLGSDDFGGNKAPNISIDDLRAMISFPSDEEVAQRWAKR